MKTYKKSLVHATSHAPGHTVARRVISGAGCHNLAARLEEAGYFARFFTVQRGNFGYYTTSHLETDAPASVLKRLK